MPERKHTTEKIISTLREAEVIIASGSTVNGGEIMDHCGGVIVYH